MELSNLSKSTKKEDKNPWKSNPDMHLPSDSSFCVHSPRNKHHSSVGVGYSISSAWCSRGRGVNSTVEIVKTLHRISAIPLDCVQTHRVSNFTNAHIKMGFRNHKGGGEDEKSLSAPVILELQRGFNGSSETGLASCS
jgi:hypothetical protein